MQSAAPKPDDGCAMSFSTVDDLIRTDGLGHLDEAAFDALPFGSIKLDAMNRVVLYNAFEAQLAHRSSASTIGKFFFRDIAPCTDNKMFRGRLEELLAGSEKRARFDYLFRFPWGLRNVRIQFWVPSFAERWIFVIPEEATGGPTDVDGTQPPPSGAVSP